jgi:hypothetical protein
VSDLLGDDDDNDDDDYSPGGGSGGGGRRDDSDFSIRKGGCKTRFLILILVYLVLNFQWLRWGLSGSVFFTLFSTSPS